MRCWDAALLLWAVVAFAAPAAAQDVESARLAFERGLAAADRGDDAEAERAFRASLELRWSASAAFNLAELLVRRSDREEARELFTRVVEDTRTPEPVRARGRERIAQIESASAVSDRPDATDAPGTSHASNATGAEPPTVEAGGGIDGVALGLALGVGLGATGAFAALAGGYWAAANGTRAELVDGCVPPACVVERAVARGNEQVDITNLFLVATAVAGAITLTSVIVVLATSGGSERAVTLRILPGYASVTGSF